MRKETTIGQELNEAVPREIYAEAELLLPNHQVYDQKLGVLASYKGETIIEKNGERYKVIGHPIVFGSDGKPSKAGFLQIYKMRDWQE